MNKPVLLSIQTGLPRIIEDTPPGYKGAWKSGFYKKPVKGLLHLGKTNLEGDGQADLKNHGGPNKAVNLYPMEHYVRWREELHLSELTPGAMGENFTSEGLTEDTTCIGDIYAVGEARIQISQPRQPCWKIDRRWGEWKASRGKYRSQAVPAGISGYFKKGWWKRGCRWNYWNVLVRNGPSPAPMTSCTVG